MSNEGSPALGGTPVSGTPTETRGVDSLSEAAKLAEHDMQERLQAWYRQEKHRPSIQDRWEMAFAQTPPRRNSEDEASKTSNFAEKRKQHYNEMDLVRWAKAAIEEESDDDEEEEAERCEKKSMGSSASSGPLAQKKE